MPSLEDTLGRGCKAGKNTGEVCDCLACNLERIASATESIAESLKEKTKDPCEKIDKCIDKIIEGIEKKYGKSLATESECKAMLKRGLGGTVEYALKCAGKAADDCLETCSASEGDTEGKCCKNCGAEKCICKGFECVPEEEEPKKKFIGWCNPETNVTAVTEQGKPAPGPGFRQVALSDSESDALAQAAAACVKREEEERPRIQIPPPISPVTGGLPACNVFDYINGTAFSRLNAQAVSSNLAEGLTREYRAAAAFGLDGINIGNIADVAIGIFQGIFGFNSQITQTASAHISNALGCGNQQFQQSIQALCSLSSVASYVGFDFTPWAKPYIYAANAACRHQLASPAEALAAYLANGVSPETVDAVYASHGICHEAFQWGVSSQQSKAIPFELMRLRRRKIYDSEQYHSGMRRLGYLDPSLAENLYELSEVIPTPAEIIRMMVRDSDDNALAQRFGLDSNFTDKYQQQLREWAEFQGMSEQHARYLWRAHWSIPSPTQLFQFWKRLRHNPKFGGEEKLKQDIKAALVQQDILPFWHDAFFAVQYNPLRLRDIRRSFQIGSLKDDELVPAYVQLGFSDDDAERMAKFTVRLRDRGVISERPVKLWTKLAITREQALAELQADGIPVDVINRALDSAENDIIRSPYSTAFARGDIDLVQYREALSVYGVSDAAITRFANILGLRRKNHRAIAEFEAGMLEKSEAGFLMVTDGVNPDIATKLLDNAESAIKIAHLKRCQNGIRSRYLTGEIDKQEAVNELIARGTTNSRSQQMVDWWGCELKSGEKHVSASTLCEWYSRGAINAIDFQDRLIKIGYSDFDAGQMLEDCSLKISARAAAKAQKEAKEEAAERSRVARILEQQAKQTARLLAQQENAKRKAAETRQRREKSLVSAAEKLTPKSELDFYSALQLVRSEKSRLLTDYGLSIDQSLQALTLAATELQDGGSERFRSLVSTIAEAIVAENISGEPPPIYIPPSTNGSTVPS